MTDMDDLIRNALHSQVPIVEPTEDAWLQVQSRLPRRGNSWWPALGAGLAAAVVLTATVLGVRLSRTTTATHAVAGSTVTPSPCLPYGDTAINGSGLPYPDFEHGKASPVAAAVAFVTIPNNWESAYGTATSHWTVQSQTAIEATVTDGHALLNVNHQPDGTWFVKGASRCATSAKKAQASPAPASAVPLHPKVSPTPTGPVCTHGQTGEQLSLVAGTSGAKTPLSAAQEFGNKPYTPTGFGSSRSVWRMQSSKTSDALVSDGTTWLEVTKLADGTWALVSATRCN